MKKTRRFALPTTWFGSKRPGAAGDGAGARGRGRAGGRAARLAALAGGVGGNHALESLEERQLLFTLTVGQVDPATGLGTVRQDFWYQAPMIAHDAITPVPEDVPLENFDDEAQAQQGWPVNNPPAPPNGTYFGDSNIQYSFSAASGNPSQLVRRPGQQQGQVDGGLRVALAGADAVTFSFNDPGQAQQGQNPQVRVATRVRLIVGNNSGGLPSDGDGLKTDPTTGTKIELLLDGQVVFTYSGAALAALGQAVGGNNTLYDIQDPSPNRDGFTAIRISRASDQNQNYADNFVVEAIQPTLPAGTFAAETQTSRFYATLVFSGPAGATVQLLDIFGRDLLTGRIQADFDQNAGTNRPDPNDRNDNGVPENNIGIGRINIAGTDSRSSLTMIGAVPDRTSGQLVYPAGPAGFNGLFQSALVNFGHRIVPNNTPGTIDVEGLPRVGVSVIVGSPYVPASRTNPNQYRANQSANIDFARADQGIFVTGGASIGNIAVWGALYGSSKVDGAVGRLTLGYLPGSVRVDGDLSVLTVQTDAGTWFNSTTGRLESTDTRITIGRTTREINVGGRNLASMTVVADVNNPALGRVNQRDFVSREGVVGGNATAQDTARRTLDLNEQWATGAQPTPFGASYYRNDLLGSAEFIGYNGTAVNVSGTLGGTDAVHTNADTADVYAFPADPTREVVVALRNIGTVDAVRIVDRDGNIIAALDAGGTGRGPGQNNTFSRILRFTPGHADVFYLVLNGRNTGQAVPYQLSVVGMAPVTLGAYRMVAGVDDQAARPFQLSLSAGDAGSIRIATGMVNGDGSVSLGAEAVFSAADDGVDYTTWRASTLNMPGNLYNVFAGGRVDGAQLLVRGNLGTLVTGVSDALGRSVANGDLFNGNIRVGGSIGVLDVKGALAIRQDPQAEDGRGTVTIQTGSTPGLRGDIGQFFVGAYINGGGTTITTSAGSQFDQFFIGANNGGAGSDFPGEIKYGLPTISTGVGSDVRFMTYTRAETPGQLEVVERIGFGQSRTYVDDAGASFTITLSGGNEPADPAQDVRGGSFLDVRYTRINGTQAAAFSRIDATLLGGASITISGVTPGVVSIGRIVVVQATADNGQQAPATPAAAPSITLSGSTEIDVWRIDAPGGPLESVTNSTPGGDVVMIDAAALRFLTIAGNLGRTQTIASNTELRGDLLGISAQAGGVGSALFLDAGSLNQRWDTSVTYLAGIAQIEPPNNNNNQTFLSNIGSPIDPFLNGVRVVSGDLEQVTVNGTVGDVLAQAGHIIALTANADGLTPQGGFEGIEGNVYARVLGTIDVGDGLRGTGPSSLAAASIVADQSIVSVIAGGSRIRGSQIQGIIIAAAQGGPVTQLGTSLVTPIDLPAAVDGIGTVTVTNGRYDTALVRAGNLDAFWTSLRNRDDPQLTGDVTLVRGVNSDLFRTGIGAINVDAVNLTGGVWDASAVNASNNIGTINADSFLNSTRLGDPAELYENSVFALNNMANLRTNGLAGDISDLTVDLGASLTGEIAARNIVRSDLSITNVTTALRATNDIRSTTVQSGRVVSMTAGQDVRSVTMLIAGPVQTLTAGGAITQLELNSTGPDGRVDLVRAQTEITGNITSSGNIGTVEAVTGDVVGSIVTRNDDVRANNGGLAALRAGRDLIVGLSILGDTGAVFAARNIGSLAGEGRDLDLRGNVGDVTAQAGQLYYDLLVGQAITGTVRVGRVSMLPGNDLVGRGSVVAFGRINAVDVQGDFNADIISRSGGIGTVTLTSGSFRPGNRIQATGGSIDRVTLRGGDLLGDVLADVDIGRVEALVGPDGFKGQIGVASWRRNSKRWLDDVRNELPPGVERSPEIDGVTIRAGRDVGSVFVERGSFTESQVIAGRDVGDVTVALQLRNDALNTGLNNAIVAGRRVGSVTVGGFTGAVAVLGGVYDLGSDGRVGGTGDALDRARAGSVGAVAFNGPRVVNSVVAAGVAPDPSTGRYSVPEALATVGEPSIGSVSARGAVVNVTAASRGSIGATSAGVQRVTGLALDESGLIRGGAGTLTDVELGNGVAFGFTLPAGGQGRATFSGPGRAFYDPATGLLRLLNSTASSRLLVEATAGTLKGLSVLGNAGASLDSLTIRGTLNGNGNAVFLSGRINTLDLDAVDIRDEIGAGGDIGTITANSFLRGRLRAGAVGSFTVRGDFGRAEAENDAFAAFRSVGAVAVGGDISGAISSDQTIPSVTAGGFENGGVRSGGDITSVTSGRMLQGRVSAAGTVGSVAVTGDATESDVLGGGDLGRDADFGGDGLNADRVFAGRVGSVTVSGNFRRSSVAAGLLPGAGGYFGGGDTVNAAGRGSIGSVAIAGTQTGSELGSERYRVVSTGAVGPVTVGGQAFTGAGNFRVERLNAVAVPLAVTDLFVAESSRVYTASIVFNQPLDASTIGGALSVFEVRPGGTTVGLAEGADYSVSYDAAKNTANVVFSRTVTERGLPQTPGVPGPGVYQFVLNAQVLRGSTQDTTLDGDRDGVPGDDFARNAVVGDAGDKITAGRPAGAPGVSFYGPADLDLVLRSNAGIGSLPEVNRTFTITGSVGDHPNSDPDVFRLGGDVDVYRISLRAGQTLRLGQVRGVGLGVARALYDAAGNPLAAAAAQNGSAQLPNGVNAAARLSVLPDNGSTDDGATGEAQYLIRETGTYYLVVGGDLRVSIADTDAVNNVDPVPGAFGLYRFDILVFDDANGGFSGDTDSGTAAPLVTPPVPLTFAGFDGVFGTGDDLSTFTQGDWTFTLTPGSGGPNSAGSVVRGSNSQGWTTERRAAANGAFGTANDRITYSVGSSIGLPGSAGVPGNVSPDVDVFALNAGQPIAPGTRYRVTLRLTETGSDIGLDFRGQAQLALFETPAGTGFSNARLVAAPSEFLPIGNQAARTVSGGGTSYGYDANGDYFVEFVIPGALGPAGNVPASYALYLQGAVQSDYTMEIVQQGTGTLATAQQNILLETNGGVINWLEAGSGLTTTLRAFSASILGFTGLIDGRTVDDYIINGSNGSNGLINTLNAIFAASNVRVNISANPNDFARQPFSTVFLAGNVEPNAFFENGTFGASQRVDAFNASKTDQAVVFVPALGTLGFEPTRAGADLFVQALSAAVARRIGEMVGLRFEGPVTSAATPVPVMASNSVDSLGTSYAFTNADRPLAGLGDNATGTIFYLGNQNADQLIRRILAPRT